MSPNGNNADGSVRDIPHRVLKPRHSVVCFVVKTERIVANHRRDSNRTLGQERQEPFNGYGA